MRQLILIFIMTSIFNVSLAEEVSEPVRYRCGMMFENKTIIHSHFSIFDDPSIPCLHQSINFSEKKILKEESVKGRKCTEELVNLMNKGFICLMSSAF